MASPVIDTAGVFDRSTLDITVWQRSVKATLRSRKRKTSNRRNHQRCYLFIFPCSSVPEVVTRREALLNIRDSFNSFFFFFFFCFSHLRNNFHFVRVSNSAQNKHLRSDHFFFFFFSVKAENVTHKTHFRTHSHVRKPSERKRKSKPIRLHFAACHAKKYNLKCLKLATNINVLTTLKVSTIRHFLAWQAHVSSVLLLFVHCICEHLSPAVFMEKLRETCLFQTLLLLTPCVLSQVFPLICG